MESYSKQNKQEYIDEKNEAILVTTIEAGLTPIITYMAIRNIIIGSVISGYIGIAIVGGAVCSITLLIKHIRKLNREIEML